MCKYLCAGVHTHFTGLGLCTSFDKRHPVKCTLTLGVGFTLAWYMFMCLPSEVFFHKIWYSERWVFVRDKEPKFKNWMLMKQFVVKSTQFG